MRFDDEEYQQIQFMNWLHQNYPDVWEVTHHSPNGGHRLKSVAQKLKLMGTKKGFPDLITCYPTYRFTGLVVEHKKSKDQKTTKEQREWLDILTGCGFQTAVTHGLEDLKRVYREYLE